VRLAWAICAHRGTLSAFRDPNDSLSPTPRDPLAAIRDPPFGRPRFPDGLYLT